MEGSSCECGFWVTAFHESLTDAMMRMAAATAAATAAAAPAAVPPAAVDAMRCLPLPAESMHTVRACNMGLINKNTYIYIYIYIHMYI